MFKWRSLDLHLTSSPYKQCGMVYIVGVLVGSMAPHKIMQIYKDCKCARLDARLELVQAHFIGPIRVTVKLLDFKSWVMDLTH